MADRQRAGREPAVHAALELLDRHGLDGLTLGAIAKELNVRAPTLYWRFSNKKDLIDEMATRIIADWIRPLASPRDGDQWRDWTVRFATTFRRALKARRDGARLVAGTYLKYNVDLDAMEYGLTLFASAGIGVGAAILCCRNLYDFVVGFTIEEQAVISPDGVRDVRYSVEDRTARIGTDRYPLATEAGPYLLGDFDQRFADGLGIFVDGFALRATSSAYSHRTDIVPKGEAS